MTSNYIFPTNTCLNGRLPYGLLLISLLIEVFPLEGRFYGKTAIELASQWGSRFDGKAPLQTRRIKQRIDGPQLMGILNVTLIHFRWRPISAFI